MPWPAVAGLGGARCVLGVVVTAGDLVVDRRLRARGIEEFGKGVGIIGACLGLLVQEYARSGSEGAGGPVG